MADSREIVLAGKAYKITVPLTLGQLIDANVGLALPKHDDAQEEARRSYQRTLEVVSAALGHEHPELTVEALRDLRGASLREFNVAALLIFEESGLIPAKDGRAGEATADAA